MTFFRFRDDIFTTQDNDEIFDVTHGADYIDLRAIDADAGTATPDSFSYIGAPGIPSCRGRVAGEGFW